MVKSHYKHYDLKFDKKQQRLAIAKFLGVDYNKAQLQVADNHAVDIQNIVYKDRINQKRQGWDQLLKVPPLTYYVYDSKSNSYVEKTNTTSINGVWQFTTQDGQEHIVFHIGKIIYVGEGLGKDKTFLDISLKPLTKAVTVGSTQYNVATELEDYKSTAIEGYYRLFIFGGNKLFCLKEENGNLVLKEVEDDSETYIPVTTIGITEADSSINEQQVLDDVNLMTEWRKNKCISGTYVDDGVSLKTTRYTDYQLDSSVKTKKQTDINDIVIKISSLKSIEGVN